MTFKSFSEFKVISRCINHLQKTLNQCNFFPEYKNQKFSIRTFSSYNNYNNINLLVIFFSLYKSEYYLVFSL